ncbi:MAG TPA: hypothetical protein VJH23_03820 [archaeon]|nr:hypothetical protein [archaeon]
MDIKNFYSGNYKRYIVVPAALLVVFLFLIFINPGVTQGIDLKGGTNIIVRSDAPLDAQSLQTKLNSEFSLTDLQITPISSPVGNGLYIQYSDNTELSDSRTLLAQAKENLESNPQAAKSLAIESIQASGTSANLFELEALSAQEAVSAAIETLAEAESAFDVELQKAISENYALGEDIKFQKTVIGPSLGSSFFALAIQVMLMGMVLLSIVIFLYFREIITSLTVIAAAVFNIIGSLALMSVFSIPVSLTTIPALLMMVGYSVDTEIVMSSRVLKRKEQTAKERMNESLITILTMSLTAIVAVGVMAVLSYFAQVNVIFQISIVLFFGLVSDLVSSTMLNAPLILAHAEKEEKK